MAFAVASAERKSRATRRHPNAQPPESSKGPLWLCQEPDSFAPKTPKVAVPRRKIPQPLDAINFPDAHLRLEVVLALVGMSRSQWYRLIESGQAPKQLRFSSRCSRWVSSSITKFLNDRAINGASKQ